MAADTLPLQTTPLPLPLLPPPAAHSRFLFVALQSSIHN
jgi:hypothetical protein